MHHIYIHYVACIAVELLLLGVVLVELVSPCAVEVYGVQDVCHSRRFHLVDDGGNHVVRVLTAPAVYALRALRIGEVE